MNDYEFQRDYVLAQIPRLLAMQDLNPLSPSFGCFHYGFWRDKVSEFSDTRFQEAGATLLLAMHPAFEQARPDVEPEQLQVAGEAAIAYWNRSQNRDGSFDEWYKYEHGFAATCFSLIAFSLAKELSGTVLSDETEARFEETARRSGDWLLKHDDLIKTNHEMCAAAALTLAGRVLKLSEFEEGARTKFEKAIECQHPEGWFNEISGMDLGYCSVLLDYAMLYHRYSGDDRVVPAMKELFSFLSKFIHPNGTISAEAGLCLNPYVSRLGLLLLAEHDTSAAQLADLFEITSPGFAAVAPYLSDDLRLTRWSHLPLVTWLLASETRPSARGQAPSTGFAPHTGAFYAPEANIVSWRSETFHAVFLPAGGGTVRVHANDGASNTACFEDLGYEISFGGSTLGTSGYDATRSTEPRSPTECRCEMSFSEATFFFPGLVSRTALRVLGAIPGAHTWLRKGIDFYRQRRRTAVNQSAAPIARGSALLRCERSVRFDSTGIVVTDVIRASDHRIDLRTLRPIGLRDGRRQELQQAWSKAIRASAEKTKPSLTAIRVVKRMQRLTLPLEVTIDALQ